MQSVNVEDGTTGVRQKTPMRKLDFIDEVADEEKIDRLNEFKVANKWREINRKQKAVQLNREMQEYRSFQEHGLDHKNINVSVLRQNLVYSESQAETTVNTHLINIDKLINVQMERLNEAYMRFDNEIKVLEDEFEKEQQELKEKNQREKENLLGIAFRMESEIIELDLECQHEFQSAKEEIKNKNLEEKHSLKIHLESVIDDLWKQFQKALDEYKQATEERKIQFETLKHKDIESAAIIDQQVQKLTKLQESLASYKGKMLQKTGEYENKTKALKEEKDSLQTHLQHLKQRINIYRENEKKKLTKLITLSNKVVKDLKKKVEFAEEILRITEINTKFETEEESFEEHMQEVHDNELSVEEQEKISDIKRLISEEEQTSIELFFQKYNRVSLNNFALESRKKLLMDENAALKAKLKEFMDGISLSNKILEDKNSLFIVNGKTNSKIKYSTKKITCVDGALFLKGQKQLKE